MSTEILSHLVQTITRKIAVVPQSFLQFLYRRLLSRVAKCQGYGGYILAQILEVWGSFTHFNLCFLIYMHFLNFWKFVYDFFHSASLLFSYLNHSWEFAAINLAVHVNVRGNITPENKYYGNITPFAATFEQNLTNIASWFDNLHTSYEWIWVRYYFRLIVCF